MTTDSDQLIADLTDDIDPETFIEDIATTKLPSAVATFAQRYDEEIGIRDVFFGNGSTSCIPLLRSRACRLPGLRSFIRAKHSSRCI